MNGVIRKILPPNWAFGLASGVLWGIYLFLLGHVLDDGPSQALSVQSLFYSLLVMVLCELSAFVWQMLTMNRKLFKEVRQHRVFLLKKGWLFLMCPVGMLCFIGALRFSPESDVAVLTATYPVVCLLLAWFFLSYKLHRHEVWSILLATIGVILLGLTGHSSSYTALTFLGLGLALLCAIAWGAEAVICYVHVERSTETPSSYVLLWVRYLCSLVIGIPILLILWSSFPELIWPIGTKSILSLFMISGLGFLSYYCYYQAIHKLGPVVALNLNISYMLWVFLFSVVTGVAISIHTFFGGVLILGSILFLGSRTIKRKSTDA